MRKLGLRTILCAGNVLSREPHALAAAGFDVTAVDLSEWATEFMKKVRPKPEALRRFFAYPGFIRPSLPLSLRSAASRLKDPRGIATVDQEIRLLWHCNTRTLRSRLFNPARRGGGTLSFLSGDLLDPSFCKGPFDVIIERRTVQLFSSSERDEILQRLAARLNSNGSPHRRLGQFCQSLPYRML